MRWDGDTDAVASDGNRSIDWILVEANGLDA